jgi:hypothetical protein
MVPAIRRADLPDRSHRGAQRTKERESAEELGNPDCRRIPVQRCIGVVAFLVMREIALSGGQASFAYIGTIFVEEAVGGAVVGSSWAG